MHLISELIVKKAIVNQSLQQIARKEKNAINTHRHSPGHHRIEDAFEHKDIKKKNAEMGFNYLLYKSFANRANRLVSKGSFKH